MHRTHHPTGTAADLDNPGVVTPADILRGAARYLDTHGWHQGIYFASDDLGTRQDDVPFPAACAVGAIAMAAYGTKPDDIYAPGNVPATSVRDFHRAVDALSDYLDRFEPICRLTDDEAFDIDSDASPFAWNDDPHCTRQHVTAALRAAADDYDHTHATPDRIDPEPVDVPLLDTGGYLPCGCDGTQRDHTCGPLD